jgi:chromatin segregation and condensation protein Rec8/ScpA/Scc1 (kleisin family)
MIELYKELQERLEHLDKKIKQFEAEGKEHQTTLGKYHECLLTTIRVQQILLSRVTHNSTVEHELKRWSPLKFSGHMNYVKEDVIEFTKHFIKHKED